VRRPRRSHDPSSSVNPVGDLPERLKAPTVDLRVPRIALAVGAHPDDIEFGCGATLAKWASAGASIHHLVLTDGSKGTWNDATDTTELIAQRKEEQRAAAKILGGGDVTFLGITDGELDSSLDNRKRVCEVIRRLAPDVLLGHDPWRRYRLHPDHRHAGWLVTDGLVAARDPKFFTDTGPPHRPDHLLLWEADLPNHVENVTGLEQTKLTALLAHSSQHRSTMGIDDAEPGDSAHAGADAGQDAGEDASEITRSQTDAFTRRIRTQLANHGKLAGFNSGEAFHRIDNT
jgi:LmbE family N-acetylglucosaminyl deacetylase